MFNFKDLRRGQIWLAEVCYAPDYWIKFKKPVLILMDKLIFRNLQTVQVAPVTTKKTDKLHYAEVYLSPDECGHPDGAKVLCHSVYPISKTAFVKYWYSLSPDKMRGVDEAIKVALQMSA